MRALKVRKYILHILLKYIPILIQSMSSILPVPPNPSLFLLRPVPNSS